MRRVSVGPQNGCDMREIPFSPKIGRRDRDFHVFNMLSERSGKLMRL